MSNKPTLSIDEIFNDDYFDLKIAKQQLTQLITDIIGEDRDYKKYEPCPRCGGQYQYKCSCDDAEDIVRAEQRQRAKEAGLDL